MADLIGELIDERYQVVQLIKHTEKSVVYLANDQLTQRKVAVKFLKTTFGTLDTSLDLKHFNDEIMAIRKLNHSNIVPFVGDGQHKGSRYLVTEYKECSLREYLNKRGGMLPMDEVIDLFEDIAMGMDAIHGLRLAHRDLKPENILLANCDARVPEPYIADFGLAALTTGQSESSTQHTKGVGTVRYMAPEAWTGHYKHPERIDVYAMGIMLYEILEGRTPFAGDEIELMFKHIGTAPPPPEHVKPNVAKVLLRALEKDPEKRYPSCGALIAALKQAQAGDEATSTRKFDRRVAIAGITIALIGVICSASAELSIVDNFVYRIFNRASAVPAEVAISFISATDLPLSIDTATPTSITTEKSENTSEAQEAEVTADVATATITPTATACADTDGVNLREGPSTLAPVIDGVPDSEDCMPISALVPGETDEACDWFSIDYRGRNGYICNTYATINPPNAVISAGTRPPTTWARATLGGVTVIAAVSSNTPQPPAPTSSGGVGYTPQPPAIVEPPTSVPVLPTVVPTTIPTIVPTVVPSITPQPTNPPPPSPLMFYTLYDANTDRQIVSLTNGSTFSNSIGSGSYNIRVDPTVTGINTVNMRLNALSGDCAGREHTEQGAPFTLAQNQGENYFGMQFGAGCSYSLTTTAYNASNQIIQSETINFSVVP